MEIEKLIPVTINAYGVLCNQSCRYFRIVTDVPEVVVSCDLYHLPIKKWARVDDCLEDFGQGEK